MRHPGSRHAAPRIGACGTQERAKEGPWPSAHLARQISRPLAPTNAAEGMQHRYTSFPAAAGNAPLVPSPSLGGGGGHLWQNIG